MQENGNIDDERMKSALAGITAVIPYDRARRDTGYHYVEHLAREAKSVANIESLTAGNYTVRSTIQPDLQRAACC